MNHSIVPLAVAVLVSGCAIVDESASATRKVFEPIAPPVDGYTAQHGRITVLLVHQRSDIVSIPPSTQHVVWRRSPNPIGVFEDEDVGPRAAAADSPPDEDPELTEQRGAVIERWPVLAEPLQFDTEVRRVDMCALEEPCDSPAGYCPTLEPCDNVDAYECFSEKPGNYCLEKSS